jgi:uncharacterized protein YfbU (UPF0304 family)
MLFLASKPFGVLGMESKRNVLLLSNCWSVFVSSHAQNTERLSEFQSFVSRGFGKII